MSKANEGKPPAPGSALVDALRETHRHIESLERIACETGHIVMTHEAKKRADILAQTLVGQTCAHEWTPDGLFPRRCMRCGEMDFSPPNAPRDLRGDSRVTVHADVGQESDTNARGSSVVERQRLEPEHGQGQAAGRCGKAACAGSIPVPSPNALPHAPERSDGSVQAVVGQEDHP